MSVWVMRYQINFTWSSNRNSGLCKIPPYRRCTSSCRNWYYSTVDITYGKRRVMFVLTEVHIWSITWISLIRVIRHTSQNTHFEYHPLSTSGLPSGFFHWSVPTKCCRNFSSPSCEGCTYALRPPWFDYPHNIQRTVQNIKLLSL